MPNVSRNPLRHEIFASRIGDVYQLNSGGPEMVSINKYIHSRGYEMVTCAWFIESQTITKECTIFGGSIITQDFPLAALKLLQSGSSPANLAAQS